ncbi:hypothetical protein AUR04nite_12050 [Glutamicibacter uratoxydans]|uniref:Uncharacterized protein n=1 Tax=Glutamicibacter uratoxydans TaxID=43667 RepID=A0A4Y4DM38_GLUUR|nr:hypothetical protein AUR04nite_12050 [Glutamicibacter uratoxydans]
MLIAGDSAEGQLGVTGHTELFDRNDAKFGTQALSNRSRNWDASAKKSQYGIVRSRQRQGEIHAQYGTCVRAV